MKALKTCLVLCVVMAAWAAMPAEASEEVASRAVPEGLSAADWAAIRAHLPGDVETSTPPRPEAYSGQIELTASDGLPGDRYGFAVAVFGDVAAVGAYLADIGGNANQGAVYLYYRNQGGSGNWGEVAKLTASDGEADDWFGETLAIYGDLIAVGVRYADVSDGAVYLYERNQGGADQWGEVIKITAPSGGSLFGNSIDLWRDTLAVGEEQMARAHVFYRNQSGMDQWGVAATLTASDGVAGDYFGRSISIDGDWLAVGARGVNSLAGAAYLFQRNHGGADNWGEVTKITGSDTVAGDRFGMSLSLDGDLLAVGAAEHDVGVNSDEGKAYLFSRNEGGSDSWGEIAAFTHPNGGAGYNFGSQVLLYGDRLVVKTTSTPYLYCMNQGGADQWELQQKIPLSRTVSLHGDTLISGDWNADSQRGEAYIRTAGDGWKERRQRNIVGGVDPIDVYGSTVDVEGEFAIVTNYYDNVGNNASQGSGTILRRNLTGGDEWAPEVLLTASDGDEGDRFGGTAAISGDTVVIGAWFDDVAGNSDQGSAYVFSRNHGGLDQWGEVAKLTASDGSPGDWFGYSLEIHGDWILIGVYKKDVGGNVDQGAVYFFHRNQGGADNWGEVIKKTADDGAASDFFGVDVALFGDYAVIGAQGDDHGAFSGAGSAYVFQRNQGGLDNWGQVAKLTASTASDNSWFGSSVDIWGDTVIVGVPYEDVGAETDIGAAYLFERNQGCADCWGEVRRIIASDGNAGDRFGSTVSLWDDTAAAGSPERTASGNVFQGQAYIFQRNQGGGDNWGEVLAFTSSDGGVASRFAFDLALWDDILMVGSPGHDYGTNPGGAVYFFYNHFPSAADDTYSVDAGGDLNVSTPGVMANDGDQNGDGLTAIKDSDPSFGTVTLYPSGAFEYTSTGCPTQDSFTYHANDGMEDSPVATVTIDVDPAADLTLNMSNSMDPACVGTPFDYVITVDNNGPCDATGVTVNDDIPPELGSISALPSQGSCSVDAQLVTCTLGAIAASGDATVTITVTPTSSGTVANMAWVSAIESDPYLADNDDSESTLILSGPPAVPSAPTVTDDDPCAFSGIAIEWDTVSGADGYDLQIDGGTILPSVFSPYPHIPPDTDPHTYTVRAWNNCGSSSWSAGTVGTDENGTAPGAPVILGITDNSTCGTGVTVTFTPGSGATSHDLWEFGEPIATGITSPYVFDDGGSGLREFWVSAVADGCHTESGGEFVDDVDDSTTPTILGDMENLCPDEWVYLSTETGMSDYQWYLGGSPISGATSDTHTATESGEYTVSYTNGSGCGGTSSLHLVTLMPCGGGGPPPAPDGSGTTTPLTAFWMGADMIHVEWDATTCPTMDYNLIYGTLANVSTYTLDGGECFLGTLGSTDWMAPAGTDVYFLIVGTDGAGIESSWGTDSTGSERNGAGHSDTCTVMMKDASETCP